MIAILRMSHIPSEKRAEKGDLYGVYVEDFYFAEAVQLLKTRGHPRRDHANLAQLFEPSGLVPTPFEERVRYIYGLSEELAHTISLFDGVMDTRVHVVLPEEGRAENHYGKASVYVKYDQRIDFNALIPRVKKLISDAVHGVQYENVELLTSPTYIPPVLKKREGWNLPGGIHVDPLREEAFLFLAGGIAALILIPSAMAAIFFILLVRARREAGAAHV